MRVLIDESAAVNQGAGIGRYARNLVPAALHVLPEAAFILAYAPSQPGVPPFLEDTLTRFNDPSRITTKRFPFSRRRADQIWFRARAPFPTRLFTGRFDIAYSPDFTVPPTGGRPAGVTVHDLAFAVMPEYTPRSLRDYLTAVVPRQVKEARLVAAVSETTRADLIARYGVEPDRIRVIPNGVDRSFLHAETVTGENRDTLRLPHQYLLMVGTLEPRKNHIGAFQALTALAGRVDLPLVVAGKRGWAYEPILRAAQPLVEAGRVVLLDYVPERLLPALYASAAVVIYPSWYEGFGLPVLEALATGTPVVASTAPALRETGGSVTLYADPASPEAIADRIEQALAAEWQSRDARRERQGWARRFTWERSGAALAAMLRELAS